MPVMTSTIDCDFPQIGYIPMPPDFKYLDAFQKGRPRHDSLSQFRLKHPEMPCPRRAKIFSPFDALKGFNEAVASKEVDYTGKPELSEEEKERLDEKLAVLYKLTFNRRAAKKNAPIITVSYFRPCSDEQSEAYGTGGTIESITGICHRVDTVITCTIKIEDQLIPLEDVVDITGNILGSYMSEDSIW